MQHFKANLQITSTYVYQNGKDPITSHCLQLIFQCDSVCLQGSARHRIFTSRSLVAKRLSWQDLSCSHSRFLRWATHVVLNCLMQWQPFSYRRFYCTNPSRETVEKRIMLIHQYDFFDSCQFMMTDMHANFTKYYSFNTIVSYGQQDFLKLQ